MNIKKELQKSNTLLVELVKHLEQIEPEATEGRKYIWLQIARNQKCLEEQ